MAAFASISAHIGIFWMLKAHSSSLSCFKRVITAAPSTPRAAGWWGLEGLRVVLERPQKFSDLPAETASAIRVDNAMMYRGLHSHC